MKFVQLQKLKGVFKPVDMETLRDECKKYIDRELVFESLWLIDEEDGGPYIGQWAFRATNEKGEWLDMGWVPEEDIEFRSVHHA